MVGVPCLYVITLRGGLFFLLLVDLIILLGLREFYSLMAAKGYRPFAAAGLRLRRGADLVRLAAGRRPCRSS